MTITAAKAITNAHSNQNDLGLVGFNAKLKYVGTFGDKNVAFRGQL